MSYITDNLMSTGVRLQNLAVGSEMRLMKTLRAKGVLADGVDADGWILLYLAANKGHTTTIILLLGFGANDNATDSRLRTACMLAVSNGHLDFPQALLDGGADL